MSLVGLTYTDLLITWKQICTNKAGTKIELTADVDWFWCLDTVDPLATRKVAALTRETLSENFYFAAGVLVCCVQGVVPGRIWIKVSN